jgi:hypothetical protein
MSPVAIAVAFLLAFASSSSSAPAPTPAGARRLTPVQAESLVREISASVERLRGLRFKTPVTMQVIDGATARQNFKSKIEPGTEEQALHTQHAYVHLALIPKSTDLLTRYLDLAEKDVAGYYEHGSKTFYLLDHVAPDEVRSVIAHELTHALEDQHYDLSALAGKAGDGDHATAITAVIEGSATAVMLAFLNREEGQEKASEELEKNETKRAGRLKVAPSFTQRSLMLPYVLGFTFLLRGKPWEWALGDGVLIADLERAYKNPPQSTRQILHPEQYWVGRADRTSEHLGLPDLSSVLGNGWSKATDGSIGELGLAVLTGSRNAIEFPWALLPSRWTNEAASGTVGDVYHHYVNGDRTATVLLTRWETERDAEEFDRALLAKGRYFFRYGVNVLVLAGDVGDRAEPLALAALQGAKFWPAR